MATSSSNRLPANLTGNPDVDYCRIYVNEKLDTWSTPHMAQAIARMAESGRAKVKEVITFVLTLLVLCINNISIESFGCIFLFMYWIEWVFIQD